MSVAGAAARSQDSRVIKACSSSKLRTDRDLFLVAMKLDRDPRAGGCVGDRRTQGVYRTDDTAIVFIDNVLVVDAGLVANRARRNPQYRRTFDVDFGEQFDAEGISGVHYATRVEAGRLHGCVLIDERVAGVLALDRKSTRLNSSHSQISYAVFCLKKKKTELQSLAYLVCRIQLGN